MLGVYAVLGAAWAADSWPMTIGRIDRPTAVRLAESGKTTTEVVRSDAPVDVAFIDHPSGEIVVKCGRDVRFRCYAVGPDGPLELCAGPGDAPCLDGGRLEIPRRVEVKPYRESSEVPAECQTRLTEATDATTAGVKAVLTGSGGPVLREERAALAAPRMVDACKGWYGRSGYRYNRAWCEVKAAEHVALFARVTGSTDGLHPVLDALIGDCCVGGACPQGVWVDPSASAPAEAEK